MINVISIVEGDGEVAAFPVLLRRLAVWLTPQVHTHIERPIRVHRDQFLNRQEVFRKQLLLASTMCAMPGWIVILLDADDDCPKDLAQQIHAQAKRILPDREISVVLANREYEAWFIAAVASLEGKRGLMVPDAIPEAENVRGAKQWLSRQIPRGAYHEVVDQPAFSAVMDLELVHQRSRSFRKLCSDWLTLKKLVLSEE